MPTKATKKPSSKRTQSLFSLRDRVSLRGFAGFPLLLSALMLGRATILGSIAPFGLAAYAAARAVLPGRSTAVLIAISLGHLSLGLGPESTLRVALLWAYAIMLSSSRLRGPVAAALGCFGLVLVVRGGLTLVALGGDPYIMVITGFEAVLAGLLVIIFSYGLPVLAQDDHKATQQRKTPEEVSCAVAFLISVIAGVGDVALGPLLLRNVTASFLTMGLAWAGGIGLGTAVGAISGVISALPTGLLPGTVGIFAVGGLLSGAFRILGKPGVVVGFFLGSLGLVLQVISPEGLVIAMAEYFAGGLLFLAAPAAIFVGIARRTAVTPPSESARSAHLIAARAQQLQDVGQAFRQMGQVVEQEASSTDPQVDTEQRKAFTKLASYICEQCGESGICRVTGEGIFDWLVLAELNNGIRQEHLPKEVRLRCRQAKEIMKTTNQLLALARFSQSWQRRVDESKGLVAGQMMSLARVMDQMAWDMLESSSRPCQGAKQRIGYEAGIARMHKEGSLISGDSFLAKELDHDHLLVVLSDGMGSGPSAAMESKGVISLLDRLLSAGFARDAAIELTNSIMLLRADDQVHTTTIDLMLMDRTSGKGAFVKVGAMPSFLRRGDEFSLIHQDSMPAGVMDHSRIEVIERFLVPGDLLVMTTDGLFSGLRQDTNNYHWVSSAMARNRHQHPKEIAENLVERSLGQCNDPGDDVSVIVLRLTERKETLGPLHG